MAVLALAAGVFTLAFACASPLLGWSLLRSLRRRPLPAALPPVTVLKPLKGAEGPLRENLESFCRQDYPCWQLLFCAQSESDPAVAVVSELKSRFPRLDMQLVVSGARIGFNPKVNNMANAYPFAKYDLILMSDADVMADPDLLRRMAAPFSDPEVGLVTAFYEASRPRGLWGALEALSVNAHFLPQALCAARFGMRFAMGAAMMTRRSALEAAGGLHNLAHHIADDFWLGESVREAGWRVELADAVVRVIPDIETGPEHFKHLVRWARTIRICQPAGYAATLIQHGFSLLTLKALLLGPDAATLALMAAIWAAKAGASLSLASTLGGRQPRSALWLLPLSEWLAFAAWIGGFASRRVLWRGQEYDVETKGRLVPVAPVRGGPVPAEP